MNSSFIDFKSYLSNEKYASSSTITKYNYEIGKLIYFLNDQLNINEIKDIKTTHLRQYLEFIRTNFNYLPTSISNKIAVIKSFFRYLVDSETLTLNPAQNLKTPSKPKRIPKYLNEIELAKLLSSPNRITNSRAKKFLIRDKLLLHLFAYAGLRKSELIKLNWEDINLGSKHLIIRNSKNKTDRIIPLHSKIEELLDLYLPLRLPLLDKALITGENGKRINKNSLQNIFTRHLNLSGLKQKKYTIHSLRHTFATNLLKRNVDIYKIKKLLGHRSIESTEIYLHATGKELCDSIALL